MTNRPLYRQVHRTWIVGDRVTSQAFVPTPKDHKQLSAYDGQKTSAESAWMHYSCNLGLESVGVIAVTEAECGSEDLAVISDPRHDNEAHVLIDFDEFTKGATRRAAGSLARAANARGWCSQPAS